LARNGREWHTLLEFCGLVNCLIVDDQVVYDPKLTDDRLVLGLKGTYSEFELSILRQRSLEALRLKAARGTSTGSLPSVMSALQTIGFRLQR
jgi:DNA invertase Pin-like site-specific DNA recombinase